MNIRSNLKKKCKESRGVRSFEDSVIENERKEGRRSLNMIICEG